jgi:hypothetical protein
MLTSGNTASSKPRRRLMELLKMTPPTSACATPSVHSRASSPRMIRPLPRPAANAARIPASTFSGAAAPPATLSGPMSVPLVRRYQAWEAPIFRPRGISAGDRACSSAPGASRNWATSRLAIKAARMPCSRICPTAASAIRSAESRSCRARSSAERSEDWIMRAPATSWANNAEPVTSITSFNLIEYLLIVPIRGTMIDCRTDPRRARSDGRPAIPCERTGPSLHSNAARFQAVSA